MIPSAVPFPVSNRLFCPPPRSDTAPPPAASAQTSPPEISAPLESRICSAVSAPCPCSPLNSSRHLRCCHFCFPQFIPQLNIRLHAFHHNSGLAPVTPTGSGSPSKCMGRLQSARSGAFARRSRVLLSPVRAEGLGRHPFVC